MTQLNVLERGFKTSNTLPCNAEAGDDTLAVEQSVKLALRICCIITLYILVPRPIPSHGETAWCRLFAHAQIPYEVFMRTSSIFLLHVTVHFRIFE